MSSMEPSSPPSSPDPDGVNTTPVKDMDRRGLIATIVDLKATIAKLKDKTQRSQYSTPSPQVNQLLPTATSFQSTVAICTYLGENLPFQLSLPSARPTLRIFKERLPKKGNFRFFFKTAYEDPDIPIIQVEIADDDEILPLFDGNAMAARIKQNNL